MECGTTINLKTKSTEQHPHTRQDESTTIKRERDLSFFLGKLNKSTKKFGVRSQPWGVSTKAVGDSKKEVGGKKNGF